MKRNIYVLLTLASCYSFGILQGIEYPTQIHFLRSLTSFLSPENKLARVEKPANYVDDLDSVDFDKKTMLIEEESLLFSIEGAEIGIQLGSETYQVVLDPRHKTELFAEINSPIKRIPMKIGDIFEKGDLLIQLQDAVSIGNYQKAQAELDKARAEREATRQLFQDELASFFELKEAEAKAASAEANLIIAEKNLSSTKIRAPYNGVVVSLGIEEHELPQTGKGLIKIIDDQILIAKFLIPSSLLKKISISNTITIYITDNDEIVNANITRIGGMIDPASSTIEIEAEIDNSSRNLKAGMTGIASFDF